MTTDPVTESGQAPDAFAALMDFADAMDAAGLGGGVRAITPVQRSDEPREFVRLSIYPGALQQLTAVLAGHTVARAKQETGELLHILAGEVSP